MGRGAVDLKVGIYLRFEAAAPQQPRQKNSILLSSHDWGQKCRTNFTNTARLV
jgi:hypothetical protein